jgi:FRG domain
VAANMTISSVTDLIQAVQTVPAVWRAHVRLWFRGHREMRWLLHPRVYRDRFGKKSDGDRLLTERLLTQDFRVLSSSIRRGSETDVELYFLQQHYRMPTRLLDWTTNPLAALFFAVEPQKGPEKDGELFMMDAGQFRLNADNAPRKAYGIQFLGVADDRNPVLSEAIGRISQWSKKPFPAFIVPARPHNFDVRINLQRSCFTFHVPDQREITSDINPSLHSFRIPAAMKPKMRKELKMLSIDPFRIFGDLEHLAEWLCEAYDIG